MTFWLGDYVADFLRVCFVVWRISLRGGEISSEISLRKCAQVVVFKDFRQLVGFSGKREKSTGGFGGVVGLGGVEPYWNLNFALEID